MSALVAAILLAAAAMLAALADSALVAEHLEPGAAPPPERERAHRALVFGRMLAQLACGVAAARALDLAGRPAGVAALLALLVGVVVVAVTEVTGRELGDALGERAVAPLRPFVRAVALFTRPAVALSERLDRALRRAMPPADEAAQAREDAAEQFRQVVAAEADVGIEQQSLLAGVFSMGDTEVHEIMVPRVDMVGVERTAPWSEVVDRVRSSEHSRLPVYDETIDDVEGVIYAKDLLPSLLRGEPPAGGWTGLVRAVAFIPRTKRIDAQLREFQATRRHMAIVVDEYGGTAGLVTIEDILEEIVGEIRDERDVEEAPIEREGEDRFWVDGRLTLAELSEALGTEIEHEDVSTVGGLVYELLGRVPRAGERLTIDRFRAVVERVVRRQVRRVYFERLPAPAERAAGDEREAERGEGRGAGTEDAA